MDKGVVGLNTQPDRSTAQLVNDVTEQTTRLVRDEIRLATAELQTKGKRLGLGAGLAGIAGVSALIGSMALVAAAALALPGWLAALIVGAVLLMFGAIAALAGRLEVGRAAPAIPQDRAASIQEDIAVVKESVKP